MRSLVGRLVGLVPHLRHTSAPADRPRPTATRVVPSRRTTRRSWVGSGRAHIEVRGLDHPRSQAVARGLEAELSRLEGVEWAEAIQAVRRVVVAFDQDRLDLAELVATVEGVEEQHRLDAERFPERPEHPADIEPQHRLAVALVGDLAGVGVSVGGHLLRAARLPTELAALIPLMENIPQVRRTIDAWLGQSAAEVGLALANALAQGVARGPLGLVVDAAHRVSLLAEARAARQVWTEREPVLAGQPSRRRRAPVVVRPREVPVPPGPVERWGDRAGLAALGGGGSTLLATADLRRASSIMAAATPKAGRLARDGFAGQLTRLLASRDVVVLDREALRRLDRVDTVVIDSDVLLTGRFVLGSLVVLDSAGRWPEAALRARAETLLDPADPTGIRHGDDWLLGPLGSVDVGPSVRARAAAARKVDGHGVVILGLATCGELVAVVGAEPQVAPLAGALAAAARSAGELVLAGAVGGSALGARLVADRVVPSGARLAGAIRDLQAEGRVVTLLAHGPGAALAAADCGIGALVTEPGRTMGRAPAVRPRPVTGVPGPQLGPGRAVGLRPWRQAGGVRLGDRRLALPGRTGPGRDVACHVLRERRRRRGPGMGRLVGAIPRRAGPYRFPPTRITGTRSSRTSRWAAWQVRRTG